MKIHRIKGSRKKRFLFNGSAIKAFNGERWKNEEKGEFFSVSTGNTSFLEIEVGAKISYLGQIFIPKCQFRGFWRRLDDEG